MGALGPDGVYAIDDVDRKTFAADGFVHLAGVLTEDEVEEIEVVYDRFLRREIEVPGKDYCDMAGDYGREPQDFSIVNVMLPRRYYPAWQGNVYERRTADIARQLCGDGMTIDYDQLLAKQPFKDDAIFAWHQDMAYWPDTPDRRTATFWLAVDALDSRERVHALRAGHHPRVRVCGLTLPCTAAGARHMPSAPSCATAIRWSSSRSPAATARCTTNG